MDDLIAFLRARLDEDEATAKAAAAAEGKYAGRSSWAARWGMVTDAEDPDWAIVDLAPYFAGDHEPVNAHIARHDPARALREVEAKRQILDSYKETLADIERAKAAAPQRPIGDTSLLEAEQEEDILRPVAEALAAVWSDHPGYRAEWRP